MAKNKLSVIVCHNETNSDFEFDENDTFGDFKYQMKSKYKINDEYELYNVNSHQYMYFKDEATMIGLIQSKALYNKDEIHFRKELERKNTMYQKIRNCLQCVGKFFTDILK